MRTGRALGVVVAWSLACGGGDPARDALVAEGVEVRELAPDGDGWRWAGVRGGDRFCQGRVRPGPGLGPLRLPATFSDEACDAVGSPVERAWTCDHRDDGFACRDAGLALQQAGDPAALPLLERACGLGEGAGCRLAGLAHRHGKLGVPVDERAAADWLERGCNLSDDRACLQSAKGQIPPDDALGCGVDVRSWYRRGGRECQSAWAAWEAGCPGGDPAAARRLWQASCDAGLLEGCRAYGHALVAGIGGPPEVEQGAAVFRRGCYAEPPDDEACVEFGLTKVDSGDPTGGPEALAAFQKACAAGLSLGCRDVGLMLRDGLLGVFPDGTESKRAFQKGCDGGDEPSCKVPGVVRP